jgi:hypothetical protein
MSPTFLLGVKFRQNAKNESKNAIFCHNISFLLKNIIKFRDFFFLENISPHLDSAFKFGSGFETSFITV